MSDGNILAGYTFVAPSESGGSDGFEALIANGVNAFFGGLGFGLAGDREVPQQTSTLSANPAAWQTSPPVTDQYGRPLQETQTQTITAGLTNQVVLLIGGVALILLLLVFATRK